MGKMLMFTLLTVAATGMGQVQTARALPGVVRQVPGTYAFSVGNIRIMALADGTVPQDLHELLRGTTPEKTDAQLRTGFLVNPVEASINAFLFQTEGRTVLVDTGSGDLFGPGLGGKLPESLAAAGIRPEQVTDILLTHVHDDHMGGLVRSGKMAFVNATVHVGKADIDFFLDRSNAAKAHYDMSYFDQAFQTVKLYVDAGKVQTFEGTAQILPGVTGTVHPGHTPGSAFYTLQSQGQSITFVGDLIHVAAVQFPTPAVTIVYDVDPVKAAAVREQAFADFARDRTLIAVPHLSFPGVGHIRAVGSGFEWVPIAYGDRLAADPGAPAFEGRHGPPSAR